MSTEQPYRFERTATTVQVRDANPDLPPGAETGELDTKLWQQVQDSGFGLLLARHVQGLRKTGRGLSMIGR